MIAFALDADRLGPAQLAGLEVIELREEPDAPSEPPREPLRWLVGEASAAQATFARDSRDPTGTAGIWRALEALSPDAAGEDDGPRG